MFAAESLCEGTVEFPDIVQIGSWAVSNVTLRTERCSFILFMTLRVRAPHPRRPV